MCQRFHLVRDHYDGVNEPGIVAEGVVFKSGKVVLSWISPPCSLSTYDSTADLIAVQDRNGISRLVWVDSSVSSAAVRTRGTGMEGLLRAQETLQARLGKTQTTVAEVDHAVSVTPHS